MLRRINAAVLASGTSEAEHQAGKTTLDITPYVDISQFIYAVQEGENLSVILQETDNRLVQPSQFLVRLIPSGIMCATAVKHIASAIAALILRNALVVRKTEHANHERPLVVIL